MAYEGLDFFGVNELLSDEERMVRDTVREFVSNEFLPRIHEQFEAGTFPRELIPKMAELGLFGPNLKGYGCAGLNNVAYGLMMQELERGDSGLRSMSSVQGSLCMYPIYTWGSDAQKDTWLAAMARGEKIGCFGLTEPNFGSNPGGMKTRADLAGDHWVLNGQKMWITNGNIADVAIVWARTEKGIMGFLVETDRKGFEARTIHGKLSLRASVTSSLHLDDVKIPKSNLLPGTENLDLRGPLSCLTQARYGICWGVVGAAQACYDEALRYAKNRVQFTRPIGGYQLVQRKLADMVQGITTSQLLVLRLGRLKDAGAMKHYHVSLAKRHNVSVARDIARDARDILGGNGITLDYCAMRHMCNLETVYTYEGTHDIHTLVIGREVTGLGAFGAEGEWPPS